MWYVIQTQTGKELEIADKCRERVAIEHEEVFVPLKEKEIKVRGEYKRVKTGLFPSYVFIETETIDDFFLRLKQLREMTKILRTGDILTPVRAEEEAWLRRLQNAEHVVEWSEGYYIGQRLVVTKGPLVGLEGTIKRVLRHKGLAVLELPMFGKLTEVTLGLGVLERLE